MKRLEFQKITLEKIGNCYYVIEFDETTISKSKKELQIRICFLSEKMNQVIERYLKPCFLGHATAEDLKLEILNAINGSSLSLSKLLTLSSAA